MRPTFNQLISGAFALLCLVALCCMYFVPSNVPPQVSGGIVVAFVVAFKDFANAFVKEHSATQPLIDALKNSAPIKPVEMASSQAPAQQAAPEVKVSTVTEVS